MNKEDLFNLTESEQIEIIENQSVNIKFIKNPPLSLQLKAVRQNGESIQYIENPCLVVQLEAVRQNGNNIQFINNPSIEVQMEAVKQFSFALRYIKNPPLEVQLEAIKKDGLGVVWLDLSNFFEYPYEVKKNIFKYRNSLTRINKIYLKKIEEYLIQINDKEYKKIMIKVKLEKRVKGYE